MTSRMNLAYVAIAALALMMSGVSAARAATQFCDIYPERCQYSGNGVYYYYPQGYRVGSAGRSATNGAAWGCVATDGKATGGSWNFRAEPQPRTAPFMHAQGAAGTATSSPAAHLSTTATKRAQFCLVPRIGDGRSA